MAYNRIFFRNHFVQPLQVLLILCFTSTIFVSNAHTVSAGKYDLGTTNGTRNEQAVRLKPVVVIEKPYILLGDIFANIGNKAGIKVAYSPQPGKQSRFDAKWLYRVARAYNLKWRPLTLKTHLIVERASQVIYGDEIEEVLIAALKNHGYRGKLEIEVGQQAKNIHVATNQPTTIGVDGLSINNSTGRFVATLVIPANKPQAKRFRLTGRIHKLIEIPVIKHRLSRGDIIKKNDIEWIKIRERALHRGYIENEGKIVGMEARRHIAARTPLTANQVQRPQLVKKGSLVNISLVNAYMRLTTKGRSLENGGAGDTIRIKNIKTKKIILAKVTGADSARVSTIRTLVLK